MNTLGVARPGIAHCDVRAIESGRTLKKAVDRTAIYRASADVLAGGWYNFYGRQGDSETANQRLAKIYASSTTVAARGIQIHVLPISIYLCIYCIIFAVFNGVRGLVQFTSSDTVIRPIHYSHCVAF